MKKITKLLMILLVLFIVYSLFVKYIQENKEKDFKPFVNLNLTTKTIKNIKEDKISYGLNLNYIADKNKLSKNNDNINLIQEVKDNLYYFNIKVENYKEQCSIYYTLPCSFEVYRAYNENYKNEDDIKDHISGYDVDLKLPYISRGSLKGHKTGDYIINNAKNFGFINRYLYDENRVDRYSHFRYVGIENAKLMSKLNLSIEKYINSFLSNIIYYVKSQDIYMYKTTITKNKIKLPKKNDYKIYMISDSQAIIIVYNR